MSMSIIIVIITIIISVMTIIAIISLVFSVTTTIRPFSELRKLLARSADSGEDLGPDKNCAAAAA